MYSIPSFRSIVDMARIIFVRADISLEFVAAKGVIVYAFVTTLQSCWAANFVVFMASSA